MSSTERVFRTADVLKAVAQERAAQDERWGPQDHPDHTPTEGLNNWPFYHGVDAMDWKARNDARTRRGDLGWDGILLEEVFEACAETDPAKIRAELVQVAAVAVAWIEALDRRTELGAAWNKALDDAAGQY